MKTSIEKLRVLITNTHPSSAYSILISIKDYTDYISICYWKNKPNGAALSRYVDDIFHLDVRRITSRWMRNNLEGSNSEEETKYINQIKEYCISKNIEYIIPTSDVEVLLLTKNREVFESNNIIIVAPSFDSALISSDKFKVLEVAEKVGFPCPKTYFLHRINDLDIAIQDLGFPLVVKWRSSYGSNQVKIVGNYSELYRLIEENEKNYGLPIIQEYIPGGKEPSINIMIDKYDNVIMCFTLRKIRYLAASRSTSIEVIKDIPETEQAIALLKELGLTGYAAIQTKYDPRDGKHKLIEVNPRWGNNCRIHFNMALKNGFNPALLNILIAKGDRFDGFKFELPIGSIGNSPIEDIFVFVKFLKAKFSKGILFREDNRLPNLNKVVASYIKTYLNRKQTNDLLYLNILRDPRPHLDSLPPIIKHNFLEEPSAIPWGEIENI
jgi:glutathione synthase/RimK-type ligase-like ATP-grasp enzyme